MLGLIGKSEARLQQACLHHSALAEKVGRLATGLHRCKDELKEFPAIRDEAASLRATLLHQQASSQTSSRFEEVYSLAASLNRCRDELRELPRMQHEVALQEAASVRFSESHATLTENVASLAIGLLHCREELRELPELRHEKSLALTGIHEEVSSLAAGLVRSREELPSLRKELGIQRALSQAQSAERDAVLTEEMSCLAAELRRHGGEVRELQTRKSEVAIQNVCAALTCPDDRNVALTEDVSSLAYGIASCREELRELPAMRQEAAVQNAASLAHMSERTTVLSDEVASLATGMLRCREEFNDQLATREELLDLKVEGAALNEEVACLSAKLLQCSEDLSELHTHKVKALLASSEQQAAMTDISADLFRCRDDSSLQAQEMTCLAEGLLQNRDELKALRMQQDAQVEVFANRAGNLILSEEVACLAASVLECKEELRELPGLRTEMADEEAASRERQQLRRIHEDGVMELRPWQEEMEAGMEEQRAGMETLGSEFRLLAFEARRNRHQSIKASAEICQALEDIHQQSERSQELEEELRSFRTQVRDSSRLLESESEQVLQLKATIFAAESLAASGSQEKTESAVWAVLKSELSRLGAVVESQETVLERLQAGRDQVTSLACELRARHSSDPQQPNSQSDGAQEALLLHFPTAPWPPHVAFQDTLLAKLQSLALSLTEERRRSRVDRSAECKSTETDVDKQELSVRLLPRDGNLVAEVRGPAAQLKSLQGKQLLGLDVMGWQVGLAWMSWISPPSLAKPLDDLSEGKVMEAAGIQSLREALCEHLDAKLSEQRAAWDQEHTAALEELQKWKAEATANLQQRAAEGSVAIGSAAMRWAGNVRELKAAMHVTWEAEDALMAETQIVAPAAPAVKLEQFEVALDAVRSNMSRELNNTKNSLETQLAKCEAVALSECRAMAQGLQHLRASMAEAVGDSVELRHQVLALCQLRADPDRSAEASLKDIAALRARFVRSEDRQREVVAEVRGRVGGLEQSLTEVRGKLGHIADQVDAEGQNATRGLALLQSAVEALDNRLMSCEARNRRP